MIEINNLTKERVDKNFLESVAKKVLKGEDGEKGEVSIALVTSAEIKKLNKKYRGEDKPTDVLSFEGIGLGEIVICPSQVKKNAGKLNVGFKKELSRVLIHGILHLLGYNHEKKGKEAEKMEKKQNHYLLN